MDSIKALVLEHDNILRLLFVVHRACLRAINSPDVDTDDFRDMVDFIRNYADKTHHGKEEEFLFKVMADELGAAAENLVRHGMLVEHDIARLYVSDLVAALDAYDAQPTDEARLSIIVAAGSYEQILRRHIQKENDVVFPYGERNLSPASALWVEDEVKKFEADPAHEAERKRLLTSLIMLEGKYAD